MANTDRQSRLLFERAAWEFGGRKREEGSARWRSLKGSAPLGEAAATPPEGSEQHQGPARRKNHARDRAMRHSLPQTTNLLPIPKAASPPLPPAERFPLPLRGPPVHDPSFVPLYPREAMMNDSRHSVLLNAAERGVKYLDGLNERPVAPSANALARLEQFDRPLGDAPTPPEDVIRMLDEIGSPATI